MASTFINVPLDITDPEELRKFLTRLVEQLDLAFGNSGIVTLSATIEDLRKPNPKISCVGVAVEKNANALISRITVLEEKIIKLEAI